MNTTTHRLSGTSGLVLGLALAACSSGVSRSPSGPTAPNAQAAAPSPVPATSAASIKGTVSVVRHTSAARALAAGGMRVTLVGTGLSTKTDDKGGFSIKNAPVGAATLHFEGQGANAKVGLPALHEGRELHVRVAVSGGQASLECARTITTTVIRMMATTAARATPAATVNAP